MAYDLLVVDFRIRHDMDEFAVQVGLSDHDALRAGQGVTSTVFITVLAADPVEAQLIACQMAAIRGRMPVSAHITDVRV